MYCRLDDRGISIVVTDDYSVVSTNFHRNVFYQCSEVAVTLILIYGLEHSVSASKQTKSLGKLRTKNGNVQGFSLSLN